MPSSTFSKHTGPAPQQGAAALTLMLMLLVAMALIVAWLNQGLLFEQRSISNETQASQALAAAEAGLAWAQAHLNQPDAIDTTCRPTGASSGTFLRAQVLPMNQPGGTVRTPTAPLICQHTPSGWACDCSGTQTLQTLPPSTQAAFSVRLQPQPDVHWVTVTATACAQVDASCRQNPGAQIQNTLALVGGLLRPPSAALTALGSIHAVNLQATASIPAQATLHAGGEYIGPTADIQFGSRTDPALRPLRLGDPRLARLSPADLFSSFFGVARSHWQQQAALQSFDCSKPCGQALAQWLQERPNAMVHLRRLDVRGPATLGSPDHPVLLVVDEDASFEGQVTLFGALYAQQIFSTHSSDSLLTVEGALISETTITLGRASVHYQAEILERLKRTLGTFVKVPGSWTDS